MVSWNYRVTNNDTIPNLILKRVHMKKILIIDRELRGVLPENNKRIIFKKNKTIIKDNTILKDPELLFNVIANSISGFDKEELNWYLEDWEVMNDEKTQIVCANNGIKLRPVHIISALDPRNGAKALFQSKKLVILKMQDGVFELSKSTITDNGEIDVNVLSVGEYTNTLDIKQKIGPEYYPMLNSYIKNEKEFRTSYMAPLWGDC